jgi:nucleoside-diphosphate-sugar epimerase
MAAVKAEIKFAVHVSSVVVYGIVDGTVTEDTPLDGQIHDGDLYARSKRQAEVIAREVEEKHGLPVSVVRPCGVYGERDRLTALTVAKFLRLPIVPLLGSGRNTIPVVYSGNVAHALRLVLEAARGGTTYDVGFDLPLTQRAMLEDLAVGLGRRPRFLATPANLIRKGAQVLDRVGAFIPGVEHLSISRVAEFALGENPYVSRRLQEELGWDPPYRHKDALIRTGRWLTEHT